MARAAAQPSLFGAAPPGPEGFAYRPDLLSEQDERALAERLAPLSFQPFDFHGHLAKRHVLGFGWRYDYGSRTVGRADPIPEFLLPLRAAIAAFAGVDAEALAQVLINRYAPGAGVGWHRDKPAFEMVCAVSLLSACELQFRRRRDDGGFDRMRVAVEPRSAYRMSGPARHVWEHRVPEVQHLRYSITFRTFAAGAGRDGA
ncbi:MAG TPA: alpha-ketoglutarate-dependent dioxygenase AlkB [Caulobacteraceae bacterium]|jgi:alkylated DNA repair dioxygenase AlkB